MPIPAFLIAKFGPKIAAAIAWAVLAFIVLLLALGAYFGVKHFFTAGIAEQLKINTTQTQALSDSAHQAVQEVGNEADNEAATDQITTENTNVIDHAEGSTAVVAPAARAAGLQSLCSYASYRSSHPGCVPRAAP